MIKSLTITLLTLLMSMGAWAEGTELKSLREHIEETDSTDNSAQENLKFFVLEKCSAASFALNNDTEGFDPGDAFFMEAVDVEDEEKLTAEKILLVYDRVKNYTSEYLDHVDRSKLPNDKTSTELVDSIVKAMAADMKESFVDDLLVCLNVYVKMNLKNRYEDESWTELKPKRILR